MARVYTGCLLGVAVLAACRPAPPARPASAAADPHSAANPAEVSVRHASLELAVDFARRELRGRVRLELERHDLGADLVLDTTALQIARVSRCDDGALLTHRMRPEVPVLGRALVIQLPRAAHCVQIDYATTPSATALLWVEPAGTLGKRHPMLFTQSQAIRARSWVPIQDSPGIRFTYDAVIHVPPPLVAVMSAEQPASRPSDGAWRFAMKQPIPAYLMALAVGDFEFRALGARTGVYAEPALLPAAAAEFAEVEQMMETAERLYGPYRWGRYDLLVLPPSFPYGGMENPRLTFLTPTVITGDRALVGLIAHELAHSWSGNLVTNATWDDFWLNEGFTTYVERRIMEELRGADETETIWYLGRRDLDEELATAPPADTRLALVIGAGRDPDDIPGEAAYEKGALFLRTLERAFGRPAFDAFMRRRFDRRAFQSTDTATFEAEAKAELLAANPSAMAPEVFSSWIHDPGLPAGTPPPASPRVEAIETRARGFADSGGPVVAEGWQTREWVVFLRALPATISQARLRELDAQLHLTTSKNAELLMYWLPLRVTAGDDQVMPAVDAFLESVGRRRMVVPLYTAMIARGGAWRARAEAVFARARPIYHPLVRATVAALFAARK